LFYSPTFVTNSLDPDKRADPSPQPTHPVVAESLCERQPAPDFKKVVCAVRAASFLTKQNKEVTMTRKLTFPVLSILVVSVLALSGMEQQTSAVAPPAGPSAAGHGTILVEDADGNLVRRQFSFSAKVQKDGTVQGNAVIHNPEFDPRYDAHIKITCLQVNGNRASFGGTVTKTSDPVFNDEFDAAFFTVVDNGEPGQNGDNISLICVDNVVGPESCQFIGPDDFPQIPIDAGNVQVRP